MDQLPAGRHPAVVREIAEHNRQWEPSPAARGVPFRVPQLTVEMETGERLPFTDDLLDEFVVTDLREHPEDLAAFQYDQSTRRYLVDLDGEHVSTEIREADSSATGLSAPVLGGLISSAVSRVELAASLTTRLRQTWLDERDLRAWVLGALAAREAAGIPLETLVRARFVLLRLLSDRLDALRVDSRGKAFQQVLVPGAASHPGVGDEFSFRYPDRYLPPSFAARRFTNTSTRRWAI